MKKCMSWKNKDINEADDRKESKINAAGLINATLEKLWNESYTAMATGNYNIWNIKLDSIWCILGGDEKDGDDADKKIRELNLKIYSNGSLKSSVGKGFQQKPNENNPIQYQWLLKKSLYLRRLQNSQGKGTAYASDDEDDID